MITRDLSAGAPRSGSVLGVVMAGGESRRFGSEKALSILAGKPMAEWALDALRPWTPEQVVITNNQAVSESLGVPGRPDLVPKQGPLGGLYTALSWAAEKGRDGVFLLACDLPLVTSELVGRILGAWPREALAGVPVSQGPLGFEPLCAGYSVGGLPLLEQRIGAGDRSMAGALSAMSAHLIPWGPLGTPQELSVAFTNVNTRKTAEMAAEGLQGRGVDS